MRSADLVDDAANLSDTLRHMAMNDEEQPVDLEIALEMALKAWWQQVRSEDQLEQCI